MTVVYEFVPAGPVTVKLKVRPGDRMTGAVLVSGTQVTVSLKNLSTHKRFSKTFSSVSPLDTSSAEWIAEAPLTLLVEQSLHGDAVAELRHDLVHQCVGYRKWACRHALGSDLVVGSHRARTRSGSADEFRTSGERTWRAPLAHLGGRPLVFRFLAADAHCQRLSD